MQIYKNKAVVKIEQLFRKNRMRIPYSTAEIETDLRCRSRQLGAMKKILSIQQQGYDVRPFHSEVLKLFCSSDYETKILVNHYVKANFSRSPMHQLIYVNSLLRDLRSPNSKIRKLAVEDSIALGDSITISRFIESYRHILGSETTAENVAVKALLLGKMGGIYRLNREVFLENRLEQELVGHLRSKEDALVLAALVSLCEIERIEEMAPTDCLLDLLDDYSDRNQPEFIRHILKIVSYRDVGGRMEQRLNRMIYTNDVCLFYSTSVMLIRGGMGHLAAQTMVDVGLSFLNLRREHVQNVLGLLHYVVAKFGASYSNSSLILLDSDTLEIKLIKLKLMADNFDQTALGEIKQLIYKKELLPEIFGICVDKDIYLPGILSYVSASDSKSVSRVLETILINRAKFIEEYSIPLHNWQEDLEHFFSRIQPGTAVTDACWVECALLICSRVTGGIFRVRSSRLRLRYFLKMREKKAISNEQATNYVKDIRKESRLAKLILADISRSVADDLIPVEVEVEDCRRHQAEYDTNLIRYGSVIDDGQNGENETNRGNSSDADCTGALVHPAPETGSLKEPFFETDPVEISSTCSIYNKIDGFCLNTSGISGMLLLDGSAIKICVDELISELNLIIRIRDESHSTRICTVGEKRLLEIGLNDLDEPIEIKIDGWAGHRFKIGLMDVVAENRMDLGLFRQKYSEMDEYAIIGRMDLDDSFYVDEDEFSIRILGDELLGRVFGNKMIIKGRKRVVEAVRSRVA